MLPQDRQSFDPITATLKDGKSIILRLLEPGDAEALGEFYESVPRKDYRHYSPHRLNRAQAKAKAEKLADSPYFICVIGLNGAGQIIGYAWCDWKQPTDDCSLLGLCIRREYQNVGAGRAVIHRLLEIVRQAGPPRVELTVQLANSRALALYQKMGFAIVREQIRKGFEEFPAEPEYLMEKRLR